MKSYDRSDGETTKAYAAFTIYRDMGVSRSLEKTAVEFYPVIDSSQSHHRNKNQLGVWSKKYNWVDRCKDYDRDQEQDIRQHIRLKNIEEHDRKLEQYRQDNETLGKGLMAIGAELMVAINQLTEPARTKLKRREKLEKAEIDTIMNAPASLKQVASFAQTGSEMNADGLLIRQLIEKIKEGGE